MLNSTQNPTNSLYKSNKTASNPGHNFQRAIQQIDEFQNNIKHLEPKLKLLSNPYLGNPECTYIDLRYLGDIEIPDAEFDKWYNDFSDCLKWINEHKSIIKEVS